MTTPEDRDLCILVNGPRHRWAYYADELVRNGEPTSLARGYLPTQVRVQLKEMWPFDTSKWAEYRCWVWQADTHDETPAEGHRH
jgi:hypothetical protein